MYNNNNNNNNNNNLFYQQSPKFQTHVKPLSGTHKRKKNGQRKKKISCWIIRVIFLIQRALNQASDYVLFLNIIMLPIC